MCLKTQSTRKNSKILGIPEWFLKETKMRFRCVADRSVRRSQKDVEIETYNPMYMERRFYYLMLPCTECYVTFKI